MKSLSVVIIAKNASALLSNCLQSVDWADDIVLLDSGSDDNTVEIASKAGIRVFINTDWQGYGIQRQRAQLLATGDYILMIDTDEIVSLELRKSIQLILVNPIPGVVYSITRNNFFLGRFMHHRCSLFPDRPIRMYERIRYKYNNNKVHESLDCNSAKVIVIRGNLLHYTCIDFGNFQRKQLNYATILAKEYYKQGKSVTLKKIFFHTIYSFIKTFLLSCYFFYGKRGWLFAIVNAQYTFNKYTELWALNNYYSIVQGKIK